MVIQNYNLYGEADDLPDVVHCETIDQRSEVNNWELTAHRHLRLHQFLLIDQGQGFVQLDDIPKINLKNSSCVNIPAGTVHGFNFKPGTHGWVLTIANETLDQSFLAPEGLVQILSKPFVLDKTPPNVRSTFETIFREYGTIEFARAHILRTQASYLSALIARELRSNTQTENKADNSLFRQFEKLIEQYYLDHWGVQQYAQKLSVTPGHLSRVCRQVTSQPASQIIEARLMREARRLLTYTNLSIADITYELGFIDPAYFSRVFTRSTEKSPRQFRKSAQN
jgi:AraC family transcriptional activator of pobA